MCAYFDKKRCKVILTEEEKEVLNHWETPWWVTNFKSWIYPPLPDFRPKINKHNEFRNLN